MLRSHILSALRRLQRDKVYASINVGGLALGIACCLLITLWIMQETSYDRFHPSHERLFRVSEEISRPEGYHRRRAPSGMPLGPIAVSEVSGIAQAVRVGRGNDIITVNQEPFREEVYFADSNFFDLFGFTLLHGNPEVALSQSTQVVISERFAQKYFGRADAVGERLTWAGNDMAVSGVIAEPRGHSHMKPNIIVPMSRIIATRPGYAEHWDALVWTYVLLTKSADPAAVAQQLSAAALVHLNEPSTSLAYELMPVSRLHVHSDLGELSPGTSSGTLVSYGIAAAILLILACSNFITLTIARSSRRLREVAMRKVLGGHRREVLLQFLTESMLLAAIAVIIALMAAELLAGQFAGMLGSPFAISLTSSTTWLIALGLLLLVGIGAGLYPALTMAGTGVASAFRPLATSTHFPIHRRSLLILVQFALTAVLLMCAATGYRQMSMLLNAETGFAKDHTMVVPLVDIGPQRGLIFKSEVSKLPGVAGVCVGSTVIGGADSYGLTYRLAGSPDEVDLPTFWVDREFPSVFGLRTIDGAPVENLSVHDHLLVTASALRRLGSNEMQNVLIDVPAIRGRSERTGIAPVFLRDFYPRNLYNPNPQLVLVVDSLLAEYLFVRTTQDDWATNRVSDAVAALWVRLYPTAPFEWYALDQYIAAGYGRDLRFVRTLTYAAFLALLISCIGLIGLTAYLTVERTKEIGIRKVLGASASRIVWHFASRFLLVVTLALIMAWPVAYLVSQQWLAHFPIRAAFSPLLFIAVAAVLIATAAASIGIQARIAARQNPVEALRYE